MRVESSDIIVWCVYSAEVREVFAQVLSDLRIPYTRVPVEPGLRSCPWLPAHLRTFYTQVETDALDAIPIFRRHGIRSVWVLLGKGGGGGLFAR